MNMLSLVCVEVDDTTLDLMVQVLGEEFPEAEIRAFRNGPDALASCLADPPALLITNVVMPGMSGIELIKAMRQQGMEVPTFITSGYYSAKRCEREGIRTGGTTRFLAKPFSGDALIAMVQSLVA
jgi:CheY-like chemotaxis protein